MVCVVGERGRQLLQREDGREIVVSNDDARLERAIRNAEAGDTILIEASRVTLTELLTISVNRLHIRGASRNRQAVIQCTGPEARIDVKCAHLFNKTVKHGFCAQLQQRYF